MPNNLKIELKCNSVLQLKYTGKKILIFVGIISSKLKLYAGHNIGSIFVRLHLLGYSSNRIKE